LSPYMAVSGIENAVLGKGTLIKKKIKRRKWGSCTRLSEQPSTKVDTRSEVIRSHCLHLLEVVGVKMLVVQNLSYRHVVYIQGVCHATGTSIGLFFKTLAFRFFKVWCTAPPRTSTGMFVRTQAACFAQMPLQSWKRSVSWMTLVWVTLLMQPPSLSCIPSCFPIDETDLGVICICVHVCHTSFPIYDRHTVRKKLLNKLYICSGTVSRDIWCISIGK
jgi:hypothetical protein